MVMDVTRTGYPSVVRSRHDDLSIERLSAGNESTGYAPLCGISRTSLPRCKVTRSRLRKPTLSFVGKFPL
jgi:hypothetical protein